MDKSFSVSSYDVLIHSPKDIRKAAQQLRACIEQVAGDCRIVTWDNIASKYPMIDGHGGFLMDSVFGWTSPDEQWWRCCWDALTSPFPKGCRYESEPFWINPEGYHTRVRNVYLERIDLENYEKQGIKVALILPAHLPLGQIGFVGIIPSDGREDLSEIFANYGYDLWLLSHKFLSGYAKVYNCDNWIPANCPLTKREVECLRWAAVGKTDREISIILSRSHATVRFHIKNAGEKLNTVNRSQTVFKAAQLGYLSLVA